MKKVTFLLFVVILLTFACLVTSVTAEEATQIVMNSGNSQSATVNTAVSIPPSVIVKDVNNTPVSGIGVTFAIASGGGSVTGGTVTTNENGIATVGSWILGPSAGSNTLTATSGSLIGSPVTFTATGISATPPPAITSISPAYGLNSGVVSITNLAGTGFTSGATVVLSKSGETNITGTSVSVTSTKITCDFDITSKTTGNWNVIVTNPDGQSSTFSSFEIRSPSSVTLSSISPSSAINDSVVTITSLAGTGFVSGATMKLKMSGANDIPGTITSLSSTTIAGTFNLISRTPGSYEVCVANDGVTYVCGLTFTVNSPSSLLNGSVSFESSPSGASAFLDSVYQGKTPITVYNITPGTYTALLQRSGYQDYSKTIKVTAGNRTYVSKSLDDQVTTTESTAVPTTITTAKTTRKSTLKTPTPWPSDTPTPASPVGALVIIGAVGIGFFVMRKP